MLGLVSFDVEAEKLAIFEVFLIIGMQVGAEDLMRAVTKIDASLCFVVGWMIHVLGFVEA